MAKETREEEIARLEREIAEEEAAPSEAEAAKEAFLQEATFGFSDEATAAARTAGTVPSLPFSQGLDATIEQLQQNYRELVREERAETHLAREEHPGVFEGVAIPTALSRDALINVGAAALTGGLSLTPPGQAAVGGAISGLEALGAGEGPIGEQLEEAGEATLTGGAVSGIGGSIFKGLGRAGRRAIGKPSLTQRALGKTVSEQDDIYARVITGAGRRTPGLAPGSKDFKKASKAFSRANELQKELDGQGFVEKSAEGFGIEVTEEAKKFGPARRFMRSMRAQATGDVPNELDTLVREMDDSLLKRATANKAIVNQVSKSINPKARFSPKKLDIQDELQNVFDDPDILEITGGGKLKKVLNKFSKKGAEKFTPQSASFQEITSLRKVISNSLRNAYKGKGIDTEVEKSLKTINRKLGNFVADQIGKSPGGAKLQSKYLKNLELEHNILDSIDEVGKAAKEIGKRGAADLGIQGKPIVQRGLETIRGGIAATLSHLGSGLSAITQGAPLLASKAAVPIGTQVARATGTEEEAFRQFREETAILSSVFPSYNPQTGEVKSPTDIQLVQHMIGETKNNRKRASLMRDFQNSRRVDMRMLSRAAARDAREQLGLPSNDLREEQP
jgi:hypothetical protein